MQGGDLCNTSNLSLELLSFLYLELNNWNCTSLVVTDQDCLSRDLKVLRTIQGLQEKDFSCVDLPLKFNQVSENTNIFSLPEIL